MNPFQLNEAQLIEQKIKLMTESYRDKMKQKVKISKSRFKNKEPFNWKKYIKYHLKWQVSIIVTLPLMYLFIDVMHLNYWVSVFLFNFVGAIMFWPIDNWLFQNKTKENSFLDQLYKAPTLSDPKKNKVVQKHCEQLKEEALNEIKDPDFNRPHTWASKVPQAFIKDWERLDLNTKIIIYYFCKIQSLELED